MLESDLRALFERRTASKPPAPPISVPAALRIGRAQRRRRRAGLVGSPILAAVAVAAVLLAGPFASSQAGRAQRSTSGLTETTGAPRHFNPLVPYAAAGWYPYRVSTLLGYAFPTALRLIGLGSSGNDSTSIVVYAAGQCVLTTSHLLCGSTATNTSAQLTIGGRAPDVSGHAAYWIQNAFGDLADIPSGDMVAFQYARGGWAMVTYTGTPADVLRIAARLRYGQKSPLRFPIRLTALPSSWREIQEAQFIDSGSRQSRWLFLGQRASARTTLLGDSLVLNMGIPMGSAPPCDGHCRAKVINGYTVDLARIPANLGIPAHRTLNAGNADGLGLEIITRGPHAPLSPAEVFAHHLVLLGPDLADWTTEPVS